MVLAVLTLARVIEPLLEDHPERARALFLGLVLASVVVPARMVGGWGRREVVLAVVAAVAAVLLTGLPPGSTDEPSPVLVFCSAALAICALVLPGVSGSFLLLSIGVYEPTIAALNDRDLGYVAVFCAGALTGLVLFVKVLQWLLRERRRATLAVMTGLMVGSLRALWPWQDEDRALLGPSGDVLPVSASPCWASHWWRRCSPWRRARCAVAARSTAEPALPGRTGRLAHPVLNRAATPPAQRAATPPAQRAATGSAGSRTH
jgi:putative membrane protein